MIHILRPGKDLWCDSSWILYHNLLGYFYTFNIKIEDILSVHSTNHEKKWPKFADRNFCKAFNIFKSKWNIFLYIFSAFTVHLKESFSDKVYILFSNATLVIFQIKQYHDMMNHNDSTVIFRLFIKIITDLLIFSVFKHFHYENFYWVFNSKLQSNYKFKTSLKEIKE